MVIAQARRVLMVAPHKKYDVSGAERFGEIEYVLDGWRGSAFQPEELIECILSRLEELQYDPLRDYLLLTGGQYLIVTLCAAVASKHKRYLALMFNASTEKYVERIFDFANVE